MEDSEKFSPVEVHEVSQGDIAQRGGFVPHSDSDVTRQGASSGGSGMRGKKVNLMKTIMC